MADRANFEPSESYHENKVVDWAKKRGILCPKLATPGQRGYPDRLFLLPRIPVFVEFKRKGAGPRKLQRHVLTQLRNLGYEAIWSDNYEEVIQFLEWQLQGAEASRLPKAWR